ncbi:MAG: multiheme c-type cytochrome, partial [Planctomycetota bacterium]
GPVEEVPTPPARPEMKGELVPTPQGIREKLVRNPVPAPRVAADTKRDSRADSKPAKVTEQAKEASERATELIDVTTEMVAAQGGPEDFESWPAPDTMLFITGNQHGYIEPCGCTGLDRQKGGLARRFTFLRQLRKKGLDVLPIDAGNQIRRIGRQAEIKFERTADALSEMKYEAVGFGPGDMRLGVGNLIQVSYADNPEDAMFLAANIVLLEPELLPKHKIIRRGHWNVGMTNILDPKALEAPTGDDIVVGPPEEAAKEALASMNADGANFRVLTFFGKEDAAKKLMNKVDGYDLIIVAGGYGEPLYRPEVIDGSTARMIVTGNKGMYVGLIGLYSDEPFRYARVELSHKFPDAPEMRRLMAEYQQQLEQLDLSGLGLSARPHLSGRKFVGSETCGKCHTEAYEIWETTAHVDATAHIVEPTEGRGDVPRHFDPECLSCHVTGWDPQGYFPYESGYLSLDLSSHLTGNGCENCHGPGAEHSAAEEEGSGVSEERKKSLRLAMQLPLEKARDKCMECHDLDNSPDFHVENAFEDEYWPMVEHYGVD